MAGHEPASGRRLSPDELQAELERVREQVDALAGEGLQSRRSLIDSIITHLGEGFALLNPAGVILDANPALSAMTGFGAEELVGVGPPHPYWPPEQQEWIAADLGRHLEGASDPIETTFMRKDGERFPAMVTPSVMRHPHGPPICVFATIKDISARRRAEQALQRSNRELQALTNCNQTLLRATDEETLLKQICRIVCEDAGYRMAWVGYAEHDEAKSVRPVASVGPAEEYLETADIVWADSQRGRGPTGTAIRLGETTCVQDYASDSCVAPWRELATRLGFRSSIALPLKDQRADTFGALSIYAVELDAFTPGEVRLLEELAADLAFGIGVLRARLEREQTVLALRESENRFRSLFEDSPVAMWEDDYSAVKAHLEQLAAGGVDDVIAHVLANPREYARCIELCRDIDANKAAVRLFEAESRDELMARNSDLYRRESDRGIHRLWAAMLAGERSVTFEEANVTLRGGEIHVLETCTVVPGHEESFDRVYIADVDITERKLAEEALRESETRYRHVVEHAPIGISLTTLEGHVVYMNPAYATLFGYGSTTEMIDVLNRAGGAQALYADAAERDDVVQAVRDSGSDWTIREVLGRRQDGSLLNVRLYVSKRQDPASGEMQLFGFGLDVTAQRQAAQALEHSTALLSQGERLAHLGSWEWDVPSDTCAVSAEWQRLHGLVGERFSNEEILLTCHEDDRGAMRAALQRTAAGEPYRVDHRVVRPDTHEVRHLTTYGEPLFDAQGRLQTVIGASLDVTEREMADEALREREERLRAAMGTTVAALGATVAMRDPYTAAHERRVAALACRIAEDQGWSAEGWRGCAWLP